MSNRLQGWGGRYRDMKDVAEYGVMLDEKVKYGKTEERWRELSVSRYGIVEGQRIKYCTTVKTGR